MRRIALLVFLLSATTAAAPQPPRVLLAVFAHPDDETFVGPVLARYAREGVKVYLAIATKGEKGTNEHAGIPAGDPLAAARHAEATCACQQLGIEPPIFFDLNDGELGAMTSPLGKNVQAVADNLEKLMARLHPQVVVTWGPDGGYGHPDHRLVSDAVTQVIQSQNSRVKLYFAGFTPEQAKPLNTSWPSAVPWHTADPAYLTVNISFSKEDQTAYHRAFECHKSQYTADEFAKIEQALDDGWNGHVSFRPWSSLRQSQDLFH
jgi:LmbE family N-acetylglucosaminyl deacetylase